MKHSGTQAVLAIIMVLAGITAADSVSAENRVLEEIVVTAQKREQDVQDVPIAITALSESTLAEMGAKSFTDVARFLPSLSYTSRGDGNSRLQVRGISPPGFGTQATTAIYFDETAVGGQFGQPDVPLVDIQRVELLRGPQGTLFGEGAIGGVLRIISNRPDTEAFTASVGGDTSNTKEGGTNYHGYGIVNIPLGDNFAFRGSATYEKKSGWIDSPGNRALPASMVGNLALTDFSNMNERTISGGRAALRYTPSDTLTIDLMYTLTKIDGDGVDVDTSDPALLSGFQPGVVTLGKHEFDPATRNYRDETYKNSSLTVTWDLGFAELTSATTHFTRELDELAEQPAFGFFPDTAGWSFYFQDDEYVSHETRLVSQSEGKLQWTAGIFYRDRDVDAYSEFGSDFLFNTAADAGVPNQTQLLSFFYLPTTTTFEHKAVFGSITYSVTDKLDLTAGARYFQEEQTSDAQTTILDFAGLPGEIGEALVTGEPVDVVNLVRPRLNFDTDDSDISLRFNATYHANDDWMVYGTAAQGFRSGGVNRNPATDFTTGDLLPDRQGFESDSLWNYEIGSKNTLLDGRLVLNSAIFLIKWEDIQVPGVINGVEQRWVTNGGKAESKGAELEFSAFVADGWTLDGSVSYTDSALTSPAVGAPSGTDLSQIAPWKYSLAAQYEFPLGKFKGRIRADYSYLDEQRQSVSPTSRIIDDYSLVNLRFEIESDVWSVELFADNLTNEYADLGIDNGYLGHFRNRPRTIGLKLHWDVLSN